MSLHQNDFLFSSSIFANRMGSEFIFCDQTVDYKQCAFVSMLNFKAEAIREVTSNPSLVKVKALRMQVNGA